MGLLQYHFLSICLFASIPVQAVTVYTKLIKLIDILGNARKLFCFLPFANRSSMPLFGIKI